VAHANPGEDFRPKDAARVASSQNADMPQRNTGIAHGCVADDRSDGWPHTPAQGFHRRCNGGYMRFAGARLKVSRLERCPKQEANNNKHQHQ